MKIKKQDKIIKTILVLLVIFEIMLFVIPIISAIVRVNNSETINKGLNPLPEPFWTLWIVDWIICGFWGIAFMILLPIMRLHHKTSKVKPMKLAYEDYSALSKHITNSTKIKHYCQLPVSQISDEGTLTLYIKSNGLWKETCIAVVYVTKLTEKIINSVNDAITKLLKAYYGTESISNTIDMMTIFCVNNVSPIFHSLINQGVQQELKNGRFVVGIAFDEKKIKIASRKNDLFKSKYKKLQKEFLLIMNNNC